MSDPAQRPPLSGGEALTSLRRQLREDLRAAVAADPSRARAWSTLSTLHRVSAQYAEAKLDAERALEADPFLAEASIIVFRLYETSLELREIEIGRAHV